MSTKSKRHTHKYYRLLMTNGDYLWSCGAADCMHHMPKHYEGLLKGKGFFCWQCGEQDILRDEHLKNVPEYFMPEDKYPSRPRCLNCVQGIDLNEDMINNFINTMGKE